MYEFYEHGGSLVWVRRDMKDRHREDCLCWACERFTPDDRETNCPIANNVYTLCLMTDTVLAVWECPAFVEKVDEEE